MYIKHAKGPVEVGWQWIMHRKNWVFKTIILLPGSHALMDMLTGSFLVLQWFWPLPTSSILWSSWTFSCKQVVKRTKHLQWSHSAWSAWSKVSWKQEVSLTKIIDSTFWPVARVICWASSHQGYQHMTIFFHFSILIRIYISRYIHATIM